MNIIMELGSGRFQHSILEKRFETITVLGSGSTAKVVLAKDKDESDKLVAIKTFQRQVNPTMRKIFLRYGAMEISLLKMLDHPNIVDIVGYCLCKWNIDVVMSFIPLGTLKQHISTYGPIREELKLRQIINQICDAVYYLHRQNVIHNDIKPDNVLIQSLKVKDNKFTETSEIVVKIADFACSVLAESSVHQNVPRGAVAYMAPEKLSGKEFDQSADWYSVGCVMYECVFDCLPIIADFVKRKEIFDQGIEIKLPEEGTELSYHAKEFLVNLLKFNPTERIRDGTILKHPYINFEVKHDNKNKFTIARQMIGRCLSLISVDDLPEAYLACQESITNLVAYFADPMDCLRAVTLALIKEYREWLEMLKEFVISNSISEQFLRLSESDRNYSKVKAFAVISDNLLAGIDFCYTGFLIIKHGVPEQAEAYFNEGVAKVASGLLEFPSNSYARKLIYLTMVEWVPHYEKRARMVSAKNE